MTRGAAPRTERPAPITAATLDHQLRVHRRSIESWVLTACGLVLLHVVQFVAVGMPWKGSRRDANISGWGLANEGIEGAGWLGCSVVVLIVSTVAVFYAMAFKTTGWFYSIAALSFVRLVLVAIAAGSSDPYWEARFGIIASIISVIATGVVACLAARPISAMSDR